jgi:uncharacterized protein (TIGR02145 family)
MSITDQEGNVYRTVVIGNQEWMAENLRTTKYKNGDDIPLLDNVEKWTGRDSHYNPLIGFCWYENNEGYKNTYGALYKWKVISDLMKPDGWRVPNEKDWNELITYLGKNAYGKLKEMGTSHWMSPNVGATNETGFTALPGGLRSGSGDFALMGVCDRMWTTDLHNDEGNIEYASVIVIANESSDEIIYSKGHLGSGCSIRLVRVYTPNKISMKE